MAKFLTTLGISSRIEDIIKQSVRKLTLVTPYLQLTSNIVDRLQDAAKRGVEITIIYGKSKLDQKQDQILQSLHNLDLYYLENLHAKCYYNESMMVLSSMNLYEYSEKNNREMGIYIDAESDQELYGDVLKEVESIKQSKQVIKKSYKRIDNNFINNTCKKAIIHHDTFHYPINKSNTKVSSSDDSKNFGDVAFYNPRVKELLPELHPSFLDHRNFYKPSLLKALQIMYPNANIELGDHGIKLNEFPVSRMVLLVSGRVDFIFPNTSFARQIKKELQWKVSDGLPKVRFFWNEDKLNIYLPKDFTSEISIDGVAEIVNIYIKIVKFVSEKIKDSVQLISC